MHSGGKDGGQQKEKQMYNNETAKNDITKIQFTYLHVYYLQHFSPKISLSSKRKSILIYKSFQVDLTGNLAPRVLSNAAIDEFGRIRQFATYRPKITVYRLW